MLVYAWRVLIVLAGVAGLYAGDYGVVAYTTQSALIAVGYYLAVLYLMGHRRTTEAAAPRLRAAVLSWLLLSGLVLHFVLAGGANPLPGLTGPDPIADWSSFLLHYVLPAMVLVDWLLFRPYGVTRWGDVLLWMLYPLGYAGIALGRGQLGFPYPYTFLNPERLGWPGVGMWIGGLAAGFGVLGTLLIGLDRLRRPRVRPAPPVTNPNWPDPPTPPVTDFGALGAPPAPASALGPALGPAAPVWSETTRPTLFNPAPSAWPPPPPPSPSAWSPSPERPPGVWQPRRPA
ncbi:Pr6Pr family membrane protein [Actinoplanes sp. L3-i22]|uniref:Pr6Pr family membrane protein n=1 Tax=Actinoplanes sp. L3-i22 TaxID=2836373 RepID=UPI001C7613F4|nr:Pr6Pr family membrane protein [Actinoplanes sp. L3-i22]BCY08335.1 hypothetical protein L3i22_034230 [Actinoplanes sp. L3-i22]